MPRNNNRNAVERRSIPSTNRSTRVRSTATTDTASPLVQTSLVSQAGSTNGSPHTSSSTSALPTHNSATSLESAPWYKIWRHPNAIFRLFAFLTATTLAIVFGVASYQGNALAAIGTKLAEFGNWLAQEQFDLEVYDFCENHPQFQNGTKCSTVMSKVREKMSMMALEAVKSSSVDEQGVVLRGALRLYDEFPWKLFALFVIFLANCAIRKQPVLLEAVLWWNFFVRKLWWVYIWYRVRSGLEERRSRGV